MASDDWRRRAAEFREPNLSRNLALRDDLRPITRRYGTTVSALPWLAPCLAIELIRIQQINEAYERLLKSDVKYRFVIDMASLK